MANASFDQASPNETVGTSWERISGQSSTSYGEVLSSGSKDVWNSPGNRVFLYKGQVYWGLTEPEYDRDGNLIGKSPAIYRRDIEGAWTKLPNPLDSIRAGTTQVLTPRGQTSDLMDISETAYTENWGYFSAITEYDGKLVIAWTEEFFSDGIPIEAWHNYYTQVGYWSEEEYKWIRTTAPNSITPGITVSSPSTDSKEITIYSAGPTGEFIQEEGNLYFVHSYRGCKWETNKARTSTKGYSLESFVRVHRAPNAFLSTTWTNMFSPTTPIATDKVLTPRLATGSEQLPTATSSLTAGDFGPQIQVVKGPEVSGAGRSYFILRLDGYQTGTTGWGETLFRLIPAAGIMEQKNAYASGMFGFTTDTSSYYRGRHRLYFDTAANKLKIAFYRSTSSAGTNEFRVATSPTSDGSGTWTSSTKTLESGDRYLDWHKDQTSGDEYAITYTETTSGTPSTTTRSLGLYKSTGGTETFTKLSGLGTASTSNTYFPFITVSDAQDIGVYGTTEENTKLGTVLDGVLYINFLEADIALNGASETAKQAGLKYPALVRKTLS